MLRPLQASGGVGLQHLSFLKASRILIFTYLLGYLIDIAKFPCLQWNPFSQNLPTSIFPILVDDNSALHFLRPPMTTLYKNICMSPFKLRFLISLCSIFPLQLTSSNILCAHLLCLWFIFSVPGVEGFSFIVVLFCLLKYSKHLKHCLAHDRKFVNI